MFAPILEAPLYSSSRPSSSGSLLSYRLGTFRFGIRFLLPGLSGGSLFAGKRCRTTKGTSGKLRWLKVPVSLMGSIPTVVT